MYQQNNNYLNIGVNQLWCFSASELFSSISEDDERALLLIIIDRKLHPIASSNSKWLVYMHCRMETYVTGESYLANAVASSLRHFGQSKVVGPRFSLVWQSLQAM